MTVSIFITDAKTGKPIVGNITVLDGQGNILLGPSPSSTTNYTDLQYLQPGQLIKVDAKGHEFMIMEVSGMVDGEIYEFSLNPTGNKVLPIAAAVAAALLLSRKKKRVGAIEKKDIELIAIAGAGLIGFGFLRQLLEKLGIWDSKDTKDLNQTSTDPGSFWNPNYWRNFTSYSYAITQSTAAQWCKEIYDAFGAFNDCEECAITVFKRCRTKANASFLCYVFGLQYGQDLLTFLRGGWWPQDRLSDADVATINNYVKNLPDA